VIKLQGRLPGDKLNGLSRLEDKLLADPEDTHVIVCVVNSGKVETDTDTGEQTVHVRVRQVEAVLSASDAESARRILIRATEDRMGVAAIPGLDVMLDDMKRMRAITERSAEDDDGGDAGEKNSRDGISYGDFSAPGDDVSTPWDDDEMHP